MEVCNRRMLKVENSLGGHLDLEIGIRQEEGSWWSELYSKTRHKAEIICPKPCRPPASAFSSYPSYYVITDDDALDNPYHTSSSRNQTRNRAGRSAEPTPDKFNLFLHKDKFEFEGLIEECCPPSRTDNPLVRDLHFISQSEMAYKHDDSATLQPILRVEGFACGS